MSNELCSVVQEGAQPRSTAEAPGATTRCWHPLLGRCTHVADMEIVYETALNACRPAYLVDHCIYGSVVVPATAYVEMALAAATAACPQQDVILQGLAIQQAMFLEPGVTRSVRTILTREEKDLFSLRICSRAEDAANAESPWSEHASGKLIAQEKGSTPERVDLAAFRNTLTETVEATELYAACRQRGLEYGPQFQAVRSLRTGADRSLGEVRLADQLAEHATDYILHPALLDACLQTLAAALKVDDISSALLPVGIDQVRFFVLGESRVWSRAQITSHASSGKLITADIEVVTGDGRLVAAVEGLRIRRVKKRLLARSRQRDADPSLSHTGT